MEGLKEIYYLLLAAIPLGITLRIVYCFIAAAAAEDPGPFKRKGKNALVFLVLAVCAYSMLGVFLGYFDGGLNF